MLSIALLGGRVGLLSWSKDVILAIMNPLRSTSDKCLAAGAIILDFKTIFWATPQSRRCFNKCNRWTPLDRRIKVLRNATVCTPELAPKI